MTKKNIILFLSVLVALLILIPLDENEMFTFLVPVVFAHCDTMDGPVVKTAKIALEKGDVTPVLKWVKEEYEPEIRAVFKRTLMVRDKGPEAKELADMYFFETLVRLHRAGEGAPYTGLKSAGTDVGHAVVLADKALEGGSVEDLVKLVSEAVTTGIRERFAHAIEKRKHAEASIEAGREFVEAYVEFVHYVERLHLDSMGQAAHHGELGGAEPSGQHRH
jgi:hypothetical protein